LEYSLVLVRKVRNKYTPLHETRTDLQQTHTHLAKMPPENAMASWLPYSLIDQVMEAARDQVDLSPRAMNFRTELDTELSNHVKRMQKLSQFQA
jgi:hypothetical protein